MEGSDSTGDLPGSSGVEIDKDTFLTSLRGSDGEQNQSQSRSALIESVNGMGRVQELHSQLTTVVGSLSDKVSDVLRKQEEEFLAAYRAHMYNVQKELQELRSKVKNAELSLQRDEKIRQLTQERDWFRREALRLDSYSTAMKKEIKYLEEKLQSIEEDRSWLEKQLKSSKKQNKLLRAELELHIEGAISERKESDNRVAQIEYHEIVSPASKGNNNHSSKSSKLAPIRPSAMSNKPSSVTVLNKSSKHSASQGVLEYAQGMEISEPMRTNSSIGQYSQTKFTRCASKESFFSQNVETGSTALASHVETQKVRALKEQLKRERETVKELRASIVTDQTNRSELEDFFVKCVDDLKKDIVRRRTKSRHAGMKRVPKDSQEPSAIDLKAIQLKHFSGPDRKNLLEKLLMSDGVLESLFQTMFPDNIQDEGEEGDGHQDSYPLPSSVATSSGAFSPTSSVSKPGFAASTSSLNQLLQSMP